MSETSGEAQISFKKPLRVRNELSGQRRNALKEYYKLKQQQESLENKSKGKNKEAKEDSQESDDEALTNEILQDKPIEEIDLQSAEFRDILQKTNKLTSSINLINSSIKDIIYNNYYELIRLNDYLEEFNDLDASVYNQKNDSKKDSVLELLNYNNNKPTDTKDNDSNEDGFVRLNKLMNKIVEFDAIDFNTKIKTHETSISNTINSLISPDSSSSETKRLLNKLIEQVKIAKGQLSLILQLESISNQIPT